MRWKKSEIAILGSLGAIGIVAIIALVSILVEYKGGSDTYDFLQEYVILPDEPAVLPSGAQNGAGNGQNASGNGSGTAGNGQETSGTGDRTGSGTKTTDAPGKVYYGQSPQVDFNSLREMNDDIIGWIYGPGTAINYPIVQGEDNTYYLNHLFDGRENKCGSIFMDSLNEEDFSNTNSIIHGHHMRDGSMFASLTRYGAQSYYDSHPVLWLSTPEKDYKVELFAGFVTDTESDAWQIEHSSKEEYRTWLDEMIANSAFKSDVKPGEDDRILTLATCSYEYSDARFVVLGILRDAE